ncbi:MAG: hypothetical protein OEX02_03285 [Cyclobacteriaceae bacterium]|nr:hypothetical protein [Cyclobacteriaceae bacterium]
MKTSIYSTVFFFGLLFFMACETVQLSGIRGHVASHKHIDPGQLVIEVLDVCSGAGYNIRGGDISKGCGAERYMVPVDEHGNFTVPEARFTASSLFFSHITRIMKMYYIPTRPADTVEVLSITYDLMYEDRYDTLNLALHYWPATLYYDQQALEQVKQAMRKNGYDLSDKSYMSVDQSLYDLEERVHRSFHEHKIHFQELEGKTQYTFPYFIAEELGWEEDCEFNVSFNYNNKGKLNYFLGKPGGYRILPRSEDFHMEFNLTDSIDLITDMIIPVK